MLVSEALWALVGQFHLDQYNGRQPFGQLYALREESCQTYVMLQYKLLAAILSAVCSVIQQS